MTNEEVAKIKVSIAKLGTSIQEVEVNVGASAMDALRKAGFNLDGVKTTKRNGVLISMDTTLADGDTLLVSMDNIKGGSDEVIEPKLLKLSFTIVKTNEVNGDKLAFTDDMSNFEIIKSVLHNKGISMNYFKQLLDESGNPVGLDAPLTDGASYKIVIDQNSCDEDCDD